MSRIKIMYFLNKISQCKSNNIFFFYLGFTSFIFLSTTYLTVKLKEDKNIYKIFFYFSFCVSFTRNIEKIYSNLSQRKTTLFTSY